MKTPHIYSDIDWNKLWQNARDKKSWTGKTAADWDKKAPGFASRNSDSPYVSLFLSRLPLKKSYSILDVGSGPGTLALPLASQVQSVTALDYSQVMLELLNNKIAQKKITNISTILGAWEDDWPKLGIGKYDLTIASRSMGVANLPEAIKKLNAHSKEYVFITDRIAPTPFDPEAFKAIGRPFDSGPDYIYTVNVLYSMGINANIDIIQLEKDVHYENFQEALDSYLWMFKDLTQNETNKLESYINSNVLSQKDNHLVVRRPFPPRWAIIWWKKA